MTTPNEIEHEQQLIKRGRTAALELIQKAQTVLTSPVLQLADTRCQRGCRCSLRRWKPSQLNTKNTHEQENLA